MGELDALRMREEVLQAMFWMRGEGLGDAPTLTVLARCLAVSEDALAPFLVRFVEEGFVEERDGGYAMTQRGAELGGTTFAQEFSDITKPGHGECDADCWCHESPEGAALCHEERHAHKHTH